MRIYKVYGCTPLSSWDKARFRKARPRADLLVYYYRYDDWEGSGMAIWRENDKYGYAYLGHCSCYGPFENIDSILYSLEQIKRLSNSDSYEWKYAPSVLDILEKQLAKELV